MQLCTWVGGPLLLTLHALAILFAAGEARGAQLTVSWIDNANGVATTRLERRSGNASMFASIADLPAGVTEYVDAAVDGGTTYCYRALVYNETAVSPYSDEACASPPSPLTLVFTDPANAATVSGTATVSLSASGGSGYNFTVKMDGTTIYAGSNASFTWNTAVVANGTHALTATVTDSQNRTVTATQTVMVSNFVTPPPPTPLTAAFTVPTAGASVSGVTTIGMASSGASGASTFTLAVAGTVVATQTVAGATASYTWNTLGFANGTRTLTLTVKDAAARTATTTLIVTVTNAVGRRAVNDFDGDGRADLAIYRPATAEWFIFASMIGSQHYTFGAPASSGLGDTPVSADYDGDGKADLAIYRKATGEWFIVGSTSGFDTFIFGAPAASGLGDVPVPGDYDGDGKTDLAIYRPTTGEWFIFATTTGVETRVFGAPASSGLGDVPVPADYDGDGKTDLAIYRRATGEWFIFGTMSGFQTHIFGSPASAGLGDTPVPADFDGDGKTDIALYRASTSEWLVLRSLDGKTQTTTWGASTDLPLLPLPQPAGWPRIMLK